MIFSFFTASLTFWLVTNPAGYYLSIILFFLTYFIIRCLLKPSEAISTITVKLPYYCRILWPIFVLCSVALILFLPSIDSLYLPWSEISFNTYLRAFLSLFVLSFFPGYFVLNLMERNHHFSFFEKIVFSYLISVLVDCLLVYFLQVIAKEFLPTTIFLPIIILSIWNIAKTIRNIKKDSPPPIIFSAQKSNSNILLAFIFIKNLAEYLPR